MSNKTRLDVLLVERGFAPTRQKAQAIIMAGSVFVAGQRVDKPGTAVANEAELEVRGHTLRYVSRGGLKLEKAMQTFPITLEGKTCADIGASTGGFTDCMLQNGARRVYAVDVGYGQLDWKLRSDERVVCLERTNARYLSTEQIPEPLNFASIDVSFISHRLVLPALPPVLADGADVVALVAKYADRVGIVHAKDVRMDMAAKGLPAGGPAGYEILDGYRADFGRDLDSVLMDEQTYADYEPFGTDTDKHGAIIKPGNPRLVPWLRPHERAVYEMLTDPQHTRHRRIEQERIPLATALERVTRLMG